MKQKKQAAKVKTEKQEDMDIFDSPANAKMLAEGYQNVATFGFRVYHRPDGNGGGDVAVRGLSEGSERELIRALAKVLHDDQNAQEMTAKALAVSKISDEHFELAVDSIPLLESIAEDLVKFIRRTPKEWNFKEVVDYALKMYQMPEELKDMAWSLVHEKSREAHEEKEEETEKV